MEQLEDRITPGVVTFQVDTIDDTQFDHVLVIPFTTIVFKVCDVNGNTSLRALVEYANTAPLNGDWIDNHYEVDLSLLAGLTITLNDNVGFRTLTLNTNFNFFSSAGNVTIERPTGEGIASFNHFDVATGKESRFTNITLHNGHSITSRGSVWNAGTAYFFSCIFTDNAAGTYGGAIATVTNGKTIATNCTFWNNYATNGGGAVAGRPNSLVTNLTNCTLFENETDGDGGAVWAQEAGILFIEGTLIVSNWAVGNNSRGGGVFVEYMTSVTINDTDISDNHCSWRGDGLYILDCDLTMTGGQLSDNTSASDGGGFYVTAPDKTVTLNQVSITGNTATNGKGGGGYFFDGTLAGQLQAGQLTENTAGGGLNGIAVRAGAGMTLTVAQGQQTVEFE